MFSRFFALVLFLASTFTPYRFDDPQSKAYHHIEQETRLENDSCTAEAVGPHALLTATHCELGSDKVIVDGSEYLIAQRIRDENDHTIYVLPAANFTDTLQFANREPVEGERVRAWGYPGGRPDIVYKEGSFTGVEQTLFDDDAGWKFVLPVFGGDSGAAILDDEGKILSVVSEGNEKADTLGFPIGFTDAQIQSIRAR